MRLTLTDHDRDRLGGTYVYAVLSRRARGLSIGLNLNPNNACNWRCVYCQVPGLTFGKAPDVDLAALRRELGSALDRVRAPGWMESMLPEGMRRLNDVALSGNGEPTSSPQFEQVVELLAGVFEERRLAPPTKLVLITNGSLVHQERVGRGFSRLALVPGAEVWFKLDAASDATLARLNDCHTGIEKQLANLARAAALAPTFVQTMLLDFEGASMVAEERRGYVANLKRLLDAGVSLRGVLLYGVARTSQQPEAHLLKSLPTTELESFADEIRLATGLSVQVSP